MIKYASNSHLRRENRGKLFKDIGIIIKLTLTSVKSINKLRSLISKHLKQNTLFTNL